MQKNPITPEYIGALPVDQLPNAINDALTQAKASGDFKGEKGEKGETGEPGPQGPQGEKGGIAWSGWIYPDQGCRLLYAGR